MSMLKAQRGSRRALIFSVFVGVDCVAFDVDRFCWPHQSTMDPPAKHW